MNRLDQLTQKKNELETYLQMNGSEYERYKRERDELASFSSMFSSCNQKGLHFLYNENKSDDYMRQANDFIRRYEDNVNELNTVRWYIEREHYAS